MSKIKQVFLYVICAAFYILCAVIAASYIYMQLFDTLGASLVISLMIFVLFCVLLYLGSYTLTKCLKKDSHTTVMRVTFRIMFIAFIAILAYFTLFDSFSGRMSSNSTLQEYIPEHLKYIPFDSIRIIINGYIDGALSREFMLVNIVGNLLAFMPFSLFLPLISGGIQRKYTFTKCVFITAFSIIAVELSQLFLMVGFCDIDDLILNLSGAVILYLILHIPPIRRLVSKISMLDY